MPVAVAVILEYCGGAQTDRLFRSIQEQNPGFPVLVLDNASPANAASCVTHRNSVNTFVGGGIKDCIRLARAHGADFLFFCANDVEFLGPLDLQLYEDIMLRTPDVVQLSCSLTAESWQARFFPWQQRRAGTTLRQVRQADLLACMLRLDFIEEFGGFPDSISGWGYSRELAWNARQSGKKILVSDVCAVHHPAGPKLQLPSGEFFDKLAEMRSIYVRRYPRQPVLACQTWSPVPDEEAEVLL